MAGEKRKMVLKKRKRDKRFQEISNMRRKDHVFYKLANRIQHLNKRDRKRLLKANDADFVYSLADLLEASQYIFPDVPVDEVTDVGLTPEELEMYERIAKQIGLPKVPEGTPNYSSPGQPRISPFPQYEAEISHEVYPDLRTMQFEDARINNLARSLFNF